jgi:hypothetical protein
MARSSAHGQIIGKCRMKRRDVVGALGASVAIGITPPAVTAQEAPQRSPGEIVTYRTATDLMRALAAREYRRASWLMRRSRGLRRLIRR